MSSCSLVVTVTKFSYFANFIEQVFAGEAWMLLKRVPSRRPNAKIKQSSLEVLVNKSVFKIANLL